MSIARSRLTPASATEAIGKAVEVAATATLALVINVGPTGAVLIRSYARRGSYQWVDASGLIRRGDCDRLPEPVWLQRARSSRRPPLVLFSVLNPHIRESIDADEIVSLDPATYHQFEASVRERRAAR